MPEGILRGVVVATEGTCVPSESLKEIKCLKCLSQSQLAMVIMLALAASAHYSLPDDLNKLMRDSACYTCLSDKQLLQVIASVLAEHELANYTMEQIQAMASCSKCANIKQIKAAITYLMCKLFADVAQ